MSVLEAHWRDVAQLLRGHGDLAWAAVAVAVALSAAAGLLWLWVEAPRFPAL